MKPPFGAGGPWAEALCLPLDPSGFVRRECSACHRPFKVRGTALEGALVWLRVAGRVAHQNAHEARWPLAVRTCPYCGIKATDDAWFTAEQRSFLDRRADTLGQELLFEMLSHPGRTLSDNPGPTFLPVRPERTFRTLPPEPDDLAQVPMVCCLVEVKVAESWPGPLRCFYCGLEHQSDEAVVRVRLERALRD